jgi:hypothetical protein
MNDFDQAARYAVRHLGEEEFFRWLLGDGFVAAWRWSKWLDTQAVPFPGEPDRRCDTVGAFDRRAGDQPPLAVIVEFMSQTRSVSLRRLTQYGLQVQEDCPYQLNPRVEYDFIGAVLNLTGGKQDATLNIQPPDVGNLGLRGRFKVLTLASASARAHLTRIAEDPQRRSLLVWTPLMKGADTAKFVGQWRAEVEQEGDPRRRGLLVALARVFAELADRKELWERGLEGIDVERSQVVLEWEKRGELRGEQRGELRSSREWVLKILRARLQGEVPADVLRAVEAQEDLATLKSWGETALTGESLDKLWVAMGLSR